VIDKIIGEGCHAMARKADKGKSRNQGKRRREAKNSRPCDLSDEHIAHHEAGHAVVATVLNVRFVRVAIEDRVREDGRVSAGFMEAEPWDLRDFVGKGEVYVRPYAAALLAGFLAESAVRKGATLEDGTASEDGRQCHLVISLAVGDGQPIDWNDPNNLERCSILARAAYAAHKLAVESVKKYRNAIAEVAAALLMRRELTADEVAKIVAEVPKTKRGMK
jgi:hypothetical protein